MGGYPGTAVVWSNSPITPTSAITSWHLRCGDATFHVCQYAVPDRTTEGYWSTLRTMEAVDILEPLSSQLVTLGARCEIMQYCVDGESDLGVRSTLERCQTEYRILKEVLEILRSRAAS